MTKEERLTISNALKRDRQLTIEWYCHNVSCPARQVTVSVKDYDGELVALLRLWQQQCPVCRRALKFEWVSW